MKLNEIKNESLKKIIKSVLPSMDAIKKCGINRVIISDKHDMVSFLFRSFGESRGVSFQYIPSHDYYEAKFYFMDEDQILATNEPNVYSGLSLDDLLPTFQNETGLLI